MSHFSFFSPGAGLQSLEVLSAKIKVTGVELDETFLSEKRQNLLRARLESDLRYVCLHLVEPLEKYDVAAIHKAALFCEANGVEAIVFNNPGKDKEKAQNVLEELSYFRVKTVFENKTASFLSTTDNLDEFYRKNRQALLCFNPAEFVSQGVHPFLAAFNGMTYRKNVFMVRVHERRFGGDEVLPVTGDSELLEVISAAEGFGRNVWVSLAPYGNFKPEDLRVPMCNALMRV